MFSAAPSIAPAHGALASMLAGILPKILEITRPLVTVALVVLLASSLGLASKHAFSVSFWPANGILAGLLVRRPQLHRLSGWIGAGFGFMAADVLFGSTLALAAFFAAANLLGTWTATTLLLRLDVRDLQLRRVHSVSRIFACLVPASFAAALVGALLVKHPK